MPFFIIFLLMLLALSGCGGGGGSSSADNQDSVPVNISVDLKQVADDGTPATGEVVSQGVPSGETIQGELRVFIPGSPPTRVTVPGSPLILTPASPTVTLELGQGQYIFQVNITDASSNIVAFGEVTQAVGAGTNLFIPLTSIINGGTFDAPDNANPGETIDINIALTGPNNRLLVPEDDFEVAYTFSTPDAEILPIAASKRGARVIMPCVDLTVESIDITPLLSGLTSGSDGFFNREITPFALTNGGETFKDIAPASSCSNVNVGVDINAPVITNATIPFLAAGETAQVIGYNVQATETNPGDSGIASVELYLQERAFPASRTLLASQDYPSTPDTIVFESGDITSDPTLGLLAFLKPDTEYDVFFQVTDAIGTQTLSVATEFTHNADFSTNYPDISGTCTDGYLLLSPELFATFGGKPYDQIQATGTAQFGGTTYISGTLSDSSGDPINDSFVVALRNDCTFNSAFNGNGLRIFSEADTDLRILDIAVDGNDGDILIAGIKAPDGAPAIGFIQRLDGDGSDDGAFGGGGIVTTDPALSTDEGFSSLAVDSSGNIYAGGYHNQLFFFGNFRINRYNPDGTANGEILDTGFPGVYDIAINPGNKLFAVGYNNSIDRATVEVDLASFSIDSITTASADFNPSQVFADESNQIIHVLSSDATLHSYDYSDLENPIKTFSGTDETAGCFAINSSDNFAFLLSEFDDGNTTALKGRVIDFVNNNDTPDTYPLLNEVYYGNNEMDNDGCLFDANAGQTVVAVNLRSGWDGTSRIAVLRFDLP